MKPAQFSTLNLDDKYTFDFLRDGNDTLLVTIGDSWTWGHGLAHMHWDNQAIVQSQSDKEIRLRDCYGKHLSQYLESDWLNLSYPGESNGWIAKYFEKLVDDFDFSPYKKVFVVITMSEVAREWMGENDIKVDYYNFCANIKSIDDFFAKQSEKISNKMIQIEQKAKQKNLPMVVLRSIAFVEDNYPKGFVNVDKTWQECLCDANNQPYEKFGLYLCQTAVVEKLDQLLEYNHITHDQKGDRVKRNNPTLPKEIFKKQRNDLLDKIDKFNDIIYNSNTNTWRSEVDRGHPNAKGHTIWAKYILEQIK